MISQTNPPNEHASVLAILIEWVIRWIDENTDQVFHKNIFPPQFVAYVWGINVRGEHVCKLESQLYILLNKNKPNFSISELYSESPAKILLNSLSTSVFFIIIFNFYLSFSFSF